MKLQIALDRMPLHRALDVAAAVAPHTDWLEVGTSLIKQYGMNGLRSICDAVGDTPVLADLKTVDDVAFELNLAYDNGASSVTVLGLAPAESLDNAVDVAAGRGVELVVDLLGLAERPTTALARRLPRSVRLAVHVGKDAQGSGQKVQQHVGPWARDRPVAVAGGLAADDLPDLAGLPDVRAIVGSAVTTAPDPGAAAQRLQAGVERATAQAHRSRADGGSRAH